MDKRIPSKAIFFDRDGIINKRIVGSYVRNPDEFILLDEVLPIIKWAKEHHYLCIVVSNQQGVGKGYMSQTELDEVTKYMQTVIQERIGWKFDDVFYATALSSENSPLRKPNPGMLYQAQERWNINLEESWMIGDSISDAEAGKGASCKTLLIGDFIAESAPSADYIVTELADALVILEHETELLN
jgi:histidinol-phosphate phosphatase family protein